jgi:hypothetical protein
MPIAARHMAIKVEKALAAAIPTFTGCANPTCPFGLTETLPVPATGLRCAAGPHCLRCGTAWPSEPTAVAQHRAECVRQAFVARFIPSWRVSARCMHGRQWCGGASTLMRACGALAPLGCAGHAGAARRFRHHLAEAAVRRALPGLPSSQSAG